MRIAILTQPLQHNYGGLLQNYALQTILIRMGHSPITFDQVNWLAPLHYRIAHKIKWAVLTKLGKKYPIDHTYDDIETFTKKHIISTIKATSSYKLKRLEKLYRPDAFIVGSDQVWRPDYVFSIFNNFLGFTKNKHKIAYAASFGNDSPFFNNEELITCKKLIHEFSAISVREDSGIEICKKLFNIDATHVLDPTMLLSTNDYESLCHDNKQLSDNYLFTYILDAGVTKQDFIKNMMSFHKIPVLASGYNSIAEMGHILSVEDWIMGIKNAHIVVCDSFHGAVFSILFNKQFWVLENENRGNTRIQSLLSMFGLEDRLVNDTNQIHQKEIDWNNVNNRLRYLRNNSIEFLSKSLRK